MQDFLNAFAFLSQNIHLAGWVFLMGLIWKVSKFFTSITETAEKAKEAAERAEKMEDTLNTLATNHLPHMQAGIDDINDTLKDLHRDIIQVLLKRNE